MKRFDLSKDPNPTYADAVQTGNLLFISGMSPVDANGIIGPGDVAKQAEAIFETLKRILDAHGATFQDVVIIRTFLRNMEDRGRLAEVRKRYFAGARPASTLVEVSKLWMSEMLVEIEAVVQVKD